MNPKELIYRWVEVFNTSDADKLAELYHDDAINHQITRNPAEGKSEIRRMFKEEFAMADMKCFVANIFEDGEWAILEWSGSDGLRGCGIFHVIDEKITFQRGYWDKLSFLRMHDLPMPKDLTAVN